MPVNLAYDDVVMDHIRNARNYRAIPAADLVANGSNPLCGDEIVLYAKQRGERLEDIAYQCTCCGISMASASILTEMLSGRTAHDAQARARGVLAAMAARDESAEVVIESEGVRALLDTVRRFPVRSRCAALPWETLLSALAR